MTLFVIRRRSKRSQLRAAPGRGRYEGVYTKVMEDIWFFRTYQAAQEMCLPDEHVESMSLYIHVPETPAT